MNNYIFCISIQFRNSLSEEVSGRDMSLIFWQYIRANPVEKRQVFLIHFLTHIVKKEGGMRSFKEKTFRLGT